VPLWQAQFQERRPLFGTGSPQAGGVASGYDWEA